VNKDSLNSAAAVDDQGQRVDEQNGGKETVRVRPQALQDARGLAPLLREESHAQASDGGQRRLSATGKRRNHEAHQKYDDFEEFLTSHDGWTI